MQGAGFQIESPIMSILCGHVRGPHISSRRTHLIRTHPRGRNSSLKQTKHMQSTHHCPGAKLYLGTP